MFFTIFRLQTARLWPFLVFDMENPHEGEQTFFCVLDISTLGDENVEEKLSSQIVFIASPYRREQGACVRLFRFFRGYRKDYTVLNT